jgi:hypothetical protein
MVMLHALVPRNLRVRSSVQVAGQRLPATGFLLVAGTVFLGGLAIVFGADIERTVWFVALVALAGLILVEGRVYGRSSREVVRLVVRHYRRPVYLRRMRATVVLQPLATNSQQPARLPRWMDEES